MWVMTSSVSGTYLACPIILKNGLIPNPVAWLLFEKVWEFGGVGVWGKKPLPHPQTPTPPYLNYATGFGIIGHACFFPMTHDP